MAETRSFTCVNCPLGCVIDVQLEDDGTIGSITGHTCKLGEDYVRQEAVDPRRNVSSFVCVEGCLEPLSVKTAAPIPKAKIGEVMEAVRALKLHPPIQAGDTVLENAAGTGIAIVATKSLV